MEEVPNDLNEYERLGKQYPLIIRSYDRAYAPKLLSSLKQRWKNLKDRISSMQENPDPEEWQKEFAAPDGLVKKDWGELENCLTESKRIGLKICSDFPRSELVQHKLFKAIFKSGMPVCLWNRRSSLKSNALQELNELLCVEQVRDFNLLYQAIWELTKQVPERKKEMKNHLGYNLGCLCDHGERIPNITEQRLTRMV